MKRENKIFLLVVLILLCLIAFIPLFLNDDDKDNISEEDNCNYEFVEYLQLEDKTIYLTCVDEVYVENNVTLKEYLESNKLDTFIEKLELVNQLKDGGTKIYKGNDITLIACKTLDGCNDIYIGNSNMNTTKSFENHACNKYFIDDLKFTRKYLIEKITLIEKLKDEEGNVTTYYVEIEVSDENENKTAFKKDLREEIYVTLKKDKWYNFTFSNKYGELIKEDIKEIFEKSEIISIKIASK